MNLVDILLVKNLAKVESSIGDTVAVKIVEREMLVEEMKGLMEKLTSDSLPIEITFKEKEVSSSVRLEIVEIIEQSIDYVLLENYPNGFTLFCEESDKMTDNDKCFIRWDSRGIACMFIRNGKFHSIQCFEVPIQKKDYFNQLKADDIHQAIMLFYGRPIEIEDLVEFGRFGDTTAMFFLTEISNAFLEIVNELEKLSQQQEYYLSKVFPLFKNKEYVETLNQVAHNDWAVTFN